MLPCFFSPHTGEDSGAYCPLFLGVAKKDFFKCPAEGVIPMQSVRNHSEPVHDLLDNPKLIAGFFCPQAGLLRVPAVFVVPVILAPRGGSSMQMAARPTNCCKLCTKLASSSLSSANQAMALRLSGRTFLPRVWSR